MKRQLVIFESIQSRTEDQANSQLAKKKPLLSSHKTPQPSQPVDKKKR